MLRIIIFSFLTLPLQRLQYVNQPDIEFNQYLNNVVTTIGAMGFIVPKMFRNNEICNTDEDCPLIMRCCEIGVKKFCCAPNNFVKMDLAHLKRKN